MKHLNLAAYLPDHASVSRPVELVSASAKANLSAFVKRLDLLISAGVLALFFDSLSPCRFGRGSEPGLGQVGAVES
jgi:hypothetical protein